MLTRLRVTAWSAGRLPAAVLAAALVACLVTVGETRQARWFELYDQAIAHIARAEWREAESKLLQARKIGPNPGRSVLRHGVWRDPFFPDYYLGVVYLNTGRPREAVQQFELARGQNPDPRDSKFARLPAQLTQATEQLQKLEQTARRAEPPVPIGPDKPLTPSGPPLGDRPVTNLPPPAAPTSPVVDLRAALDQVIKTARTQLAAGNGSAALKTIEDGRRRGLDTAALNQAEREIRREGAAAEVRRAIEARNLTGAAAALAALESIDAAWATTAGLRGTVAALRTTLDRLGIERRAMSAFFAGNYQQSLDLLEATQKADAAPSARGSFYRACSLAALALTANPPDAARLSEARRYYARASRTPGDLARDRRYISPEILRQLAGS